MKGFKQSSFTVIFAHVVSQMCPTVLGQCSLVLCRTKCSWTHPSRPVMCEVVLWEVKSLLHCPLMPSTWPSPDCCFDTRPFRLSVNPESDLCKLKLNARIFSRCFWRRLLGLRVTSPWKQTASAVSMATRCWLWASFALTVPMMYCSLSIIRLSPRSSSTGKKRLITAWKHHLDWENTCVLPWSDPREKRTAFRADCVRVRARPWVTEIKTSADWLRPNPVQIISTHKGRSPTHTHTHTQRETPPHTHTQTHTHTRARARAKVNSYH